MEIDDKNLKQILVDQREEYQRYLGVLTESFESQVKLIAESLSGVQNQLTSIRDFVVKNTEDIEEIKMELHIVRGDSKKQTSQDEYRLLEERVVKLEKLASRK